MEFFNKSCNRIHKNKTSRFTEYQMLIELYDRSRDMYPYLEVNYENNLFLGCMRRRTRDPGIPTTRPSY